MLDINASQQDDVIMPLLASGRKKRWSYSSLFFSLFFFVPLLLSMPLPVQVWVYQLLGYASFVVIYVFAINKPTHHLPYYLSLLVVLAYALSFQNPGGAVVFGFVAFIIGYYYSFTKGMVFIVAIALSMALLQLLVLQNQGFYLLAATINSVVLFGFGAMERKETLYQLNEMKHAESMKTLSAIAERERIGRDLHDVAGHALSSISLKAQLADKLLDKNEIALAQQEVKMLAKLSQELLSDIRHAVSDIKHLTLSDEIAKDVALLRENSFDVVDNVADGLERHITSLEESQLALIFKELTTNSLRHSVGKQVTISIDVKDRTLVMSYQDHGAATDKHGVVEGNGLTGIRERASSIGATVNFSSEPTTAFSCLLSLQLKPE